MLKDLNDLRLLYQERSTYYLHSAEAIETLNGERFQRSAHFAELADQIASVQSSIGQTLRTNLTISEFPEGAKVELYSLSNRLLDECFARIRVHSSNGNCGTSERMYQIGRATCYRPREISREEFEQLWLQDNQGTTR